MPIDPETYVFDFGKHKGKTYSELVNSLFWEHIEYILWAHKSADRFTLPEKELERLREKSKRHQADKRQRLDQWYKHGRFGG